MRTDDYSIDAQQLRRIRQHARRALEAANAMGCFPTPVDQVIAAAKHMVAEEQEIDAGFLAKARKSVGNALKRALSKVIGFLDVSARMIHLDKLVPVHKLPFLKLHELGHGVLSWQREMYAVIEDCKKTIDPEVSELFERESNAFASEVLFQLDTFTKEAADLPFGLKAPLKLAKRYGASVYSCVRRYVTTNSRTCAVIVLDPPKLIPGDGFRASVRRIVASPQFSSQFSNLQLPEALTPDHQIGRMVPTGGRKMSRPQTLAIRDTNGVRHECIAEAFAYPYYVFVLIYPQATLTKKILLVNQK